MNNIYYDRIESLRDLMARKGWDAVVLRGGDPHCSEYLAPRYQCVTFLTGFTGEAGDVVVTMDQAGLWTDSRYFIQANAQLEGTGVDLHKTRQVDSVYIPEFLASLGVNVVACDGLCESVDSIASIRKACENTKGFCLELVPDLMDEIWENRPGVPSTPIITLDETTVGFTRVQKLSWLRDWMQAEGLDYFLVSSLDEVAWMLNVRAKDIEYNPVVFSYLLVGRDSTDWFVRKDHVYDSRNEDTEDSFESVQSDGVSVETYDGVEAALRRLVCGGAVIAADPATLNGQVYSAIEESCRLVSSPIPLKKSVKTPEEIAGMREAFMEDGLAVEKYLYWLENVLEGGPVSEWDAACKLGRLRAEIPGYQGDSFETISAWGPGGALPHYVTPKDGSTLIEPHGLYLCDSGGQYLFGTTDITRTVPVGETTRLEKEDYTLVLKGMIDLSMAVFPFGTAGCQIDALAREPMWRTGRNFGHGTGHGIGFFLCVHEGPQSIRQNFLSQPLLPGMITSNEPGLYREGMHGIRHENVILCRDAYENEFGRWLCFETLTCCHIYTGAVLPELLTEDEKQWLNAYNERVYRSFASATDDEDFRNWLRRKTLPLE